jgi:hypothetical protein
MRPFMTLGMSLGRKYYLNSDKDVLKFYHDVLLPDDNQWFARMSKLIKDLAYIAL